MTRQLSVNLGSASTSVASAVGSTTLSEGATAIAGHPELGMRMFRRWEASADPDIDWIVAENRKKARFKRLAGAS